MTELKKLDTQKKSQAYSDLKAERNRARAKAQSTRTGDPLRIPKSLPRNVSKEDASTGTPWQRAHKQRMNETMDKRRAGEQLSPGERVAYAGKLRADRLKSKKQREERKKPSLRDRLASNPQRTISLGRWVAFGMVALAQDLVPLAFDLFAIGWIVNYIMLPLTWFLYWYLIIRLVPRKMKKKFWGRSALMSLAGLIPYVGEFLPEWIATAIGGWLMVNKPQWASKLTERGEKKESGGKEGEQAEAAATPSSA